MNNAQQITDSLARDVRDWITAAEGNEVAPLVISDFEYAIEDLDPAERRIMIRRWWDTYQQLRRLGENDD